jgi:transglutaminase-like putative cysteine protease
MVLIGSGLGLGAYLFLRPALDSGSTLGSTFSIADQHYKEARDLETNGELTLARLKYTQARDLFERQGNQDKLNQANEGIARTLQLAEDYSLDMPAVLQLMSQKIRYFQSNDLNNWELQGLVEARFIDGQKRYHTNLIENMAYQDPQIAQRLIGWNEYHTALAGQLTPFVLGNPNQSRIQVLQNPRTFQANCRVKFDYTKLPPYQTVSCWIPYPILAPSQTEVHLVSVNPQASLLYPPQLDREIGTAYVEMKNTNNQDLYLDLSYSFKTYEISPQINPDLVGTYLPEDELYQRFTKSEPHLEQSSQMKELAAQIVAEEENPYRKAQRIYNWIQDNIKMSHVSYPLVSASSASHYLLDKKAGDSTLQAFLFTNLCRTAGVPARVNSGYRLIPGYEAPWTWAEFYLPNYGWIPVDPAMAKTICLARGFSEAQKERVKEYYFGHLDPYRLLINQTAPGSLYPVKTTERNMSLIFQQPEAEAGGQNISPATIDYSISFKTIELP